MPGKMPTETPGTARRKIQPKTKRGQGSGRGDISNAASPTKGRPDSPGTDRGKGHLLPHKDRSRTPKASLRRVRPEQPSEQRRPRRETRAPARLSEQGGGRPGALEETRPRLGERPPEPRAVCALARPLALPPLPLPAAADRRRGAGRPPARLSSAAPSRRAPGAAAHPEPPPHPGPGDRGGGGGGGGGAWRVPFAAAAGSVPRFSSDAGPAPEVGMRERAQPGLGWRADTL
ncbi:uncharacterized protein LOC143819904 isoform X2 [Paroedura picta]|uniref:uncharacterized protein LOC143819904 isoform X2 n=1 Tax=Paroedura picta TaxID=143630 RepID=UPI0040568B09